MGFSQPEIQIHLHLSCVVAEVQGHLVLVRSSSGWPNKNGIFAINNYAFSKFLYWMLLWVVLLAFFFPPEYLCSSGAILSF